MTRLFSRLLTTTALILTIPVAAALLATAMIAAALIVTVPAMAADQNDEMPEAEEPLVPDLGGNYQKIKDLLAKDGYTLTKAELEGSLIEAEATKDGKDWEVMIDPRTGQIVDIKPGD